MTTAADLTPRQLAVAALVAKGHTDKEIAGALGIAYNTVRAHVAELARRLGIRSGNTRVRITIWWHCQMPDLIAFLAHDTEAA